MEQDASLKACLMVTCHPSPSSLCARIAGMISETLEARGRPLLVDDLVAMELSPVIGRRDFETIYENQIPEDVARLVRHLRAAEELVFVLPVWMYGMPAVLKGYFDRVWRPHVAYRMAGEHVEPLLVDITRMTVIVTHGRNKSESDLVGDSTELFFSTSLPSLLPNLRSNKRFDFYALDTPDERSIERTLRDIRDHFDRA